MRVENGSVPGRRIFVGNLPSSVSEDVLRDEFSDFGNVDKVDLKIKAGMDGDETRFAFVTFSLTTDDDINKCLKRFSRNKFHGEYLKVQIARESFMERLKREWSERDEKQSKQNNQQNFASEQNKIQVNETQNNTPKLPKITKFNEKKSGSSSSSSSSDSSSDSESAKDTKAKSHQVTPVAKVKAKEEVVDTTVFIAKKNAQSSVQNGKIKIKSNAAEPIHVIHKNNKVHRTLEGAAQESDKKRKESLHKMKDQYNKQKLAIKQALANIDSAKKSSKIIFDNDDDDTATQNLAQSKAEDNQRTDLFNDTDNEDEMEDYGKSFEIKKQFQGEKGEKLLKLQSNFKLDPRFAMDTKFLDDNNEVNGKESAHEEPPAAGNDERTLQLGIIEQIVGKKIDTHRLTKKKPATSLITRFDPSKEEHKKFYKNEKEEDTNQSKVRDGKFEPVVEVSKERYYQVSDDLKESIMTSGKGFSLLAMLGRDKASPERTDMFQQYFEVPLANKNKSAIAFGNPFKYDSSDSENDEKCEEKKKSSDNKRQDVQKSHKAPKSSNAKKPLDPADMFFLLPSDTRLEEGAYFFKTPEIDPNRNYDELKRDLRRIIVRKIAKKRKYTEGFKTVANKFKRSRRAR